ncbi:hypothetical protein [Pseudonocardia spinosispora]|uniref:hypothetical protein n=1 Tax=Pseudonocardia spinosispora TaxID=103441 RepID=UPI0004231CAE|nr:hypothetical protein [Pseudonocardia spinosispora]
MRARTALAGTTLALLTLLWTAPAALAADESDTPGAAAATSTESAPGESGGGQAEGSAQRQRVQQPEPTTTREREPEPTPTTRPTPTTTNRPEPTPTRTTTKQPAPSVSTLPAPVATTTTSAPANAIIAPKASLSLSPKTVRPGETVTANVSCQNSQQQSLVGDGVNFNGNSARIDDNTSVGNHTVTLVCANGPETVRATDSFQVAKDPNSQPLKASLALSPKTVRPGYSIDSGAVCQGGRVQSLQGDSVRFSGTTGWVDQNAGEGDHSVTLVCSNGRQTDTATDRFRVDRAGGNDGKLRATLKVSPRTVRQGDAIWANGECINGRQDGPLRGDDVSFNGDRGWVNDNAREGDHRVTRVCVNGNDRAEATDTFRVIRGDGGGPGGRGPRDPWLSDRSGYEGDAIDVSVRCNDNRARLESDVLDDITLDGRRGGGDGMNRLTGTTHVNRHANKGWGKVTISCDGNRETTWFHVLRDRGDHDRYLSLSPGYGHRGDAIDVNVGCDWSVGDLDSDVLDDIDVDHDGKDWRYSGVTHVRDDAEPGEHTIRIRCGNDTLEEDFFVQGDGDHDGDGGDGDGGSAGGGDTVSVYPQGAPETGGGPINNSAAMFTLGLAGMTGAAGVGSASARRGVRR